MRHGMYIRKSTRAPTRARPTQLRVGRVGEPDIGADAGAEN